jgi:hypothetical protein
MNFELVLSSDVFWLVFGGVLISLALYNWFDRITGFGRILAFTVTSIAIGPHCWLAWNGISLTAADMLTLGALSFMMVQVTIFLSGSLTSGTQNRSEVLVFGLSGLVGLLTAVLFNMAVAYLFWNFQGEVSLLPLAILLGPVVITSSLPNLVNVDSMFTDASRTGSEMVRRAVFAAMTASLVGLTILGPFTEDAPAAMLSIGALPLFILQFAAAIVIIRFSPRFVNVIRVMFRVSERAHGIESLLIGLLVLFLVTKIGSLIALSSLAAAFITGLTFRSFTPMKSYETSRVFRDIANLVVNATFFVCYGLMTDYSVAASIPWFFLFMSFGIGRILAGHVVSRLSTFHMAEDQGSTGWSNYLFGSKLVYRKPARSENALFGIAFSPPALLSIAIVTIYAEREALPTEATGSALMAFITWTLLASLFEARQGYRKAARQIEASVIHSLKQLKVKDSGKDCPLVKIKGADRITRSRSKAVNVVTSRVLLWLRDNWPNEQKPPPETLAKLRRGLRKGFVKAEIIERCIVVLIPQLPKGSSPISCFSYFPIALTGEDGRVDFAIFVFYDESTERPVFSSAIDRLMNDFKPVGKLRFIVKLLRKDQELKEFRVNLAEAVTQSEVPTPNWISYLLNLSCVRRFSVSRFGRLLSRNAVLLRFYEEGLLFISEIYNVLFSTKNSDPNDEEQPKGDSDADMSTFDDLSDEEPDESPPTAETSQPSE